MKSGILAGRLTWLFSLLLVLPLSACAMYQPPVTLSADDLKPLEFSEVVTADGLTKEQLYSAAQAWFGSTFRSAKTVFDVQDREAGRIIGKPLFEYEPSRLSGSAVIRGVVTYNVTIEVKDGRYRYIIGNFVHEGSKSYYQGIALSPLSFGLITPAENCPYPIQTTSDLVQATWQELQSRAKTEAVQLVAALKKNMIQPVQKTNW